MTLDTRPRIFIQEEKPVRKNISMSKDMEAALEKIASIQKTTSNILIEDVLERFLVEMALSGIVGVPKGEEENFKLLKSIILREGSKRP